MDPKRFVKNALYKIYQLGFKPTIIEGEKGIAAVGHRAYVGGTGRNWDRIGKLQFDFLVTQGLKPDDILLDIGCGSLRGGVYLIPYLNPGNYLGLDKERQLIDLGIECELGQELYEERRPEFVVSDSFDVALFFKQPNVIIAQSLMTHLNARDTEHCLRQVRKHVASGAKFFVTFFETKKPEENKEASHSHKRFEFTRQEMEQFGIRTGWKPIYIGKWNHPRNQRMILYAAE